MRKGLIFSYDAIIFSLLLSLLFISLSSPHADGSSHFLILQKQHDLVKVWLLEASFDPDSMAKDFEFVFPSKKGFIIVDGRKLFIDGTGSESIVTETTYVKNLKVNKLTIAVYH